MAEKRIRTLLTRVPDPGLFGAGAAIMVLVVALIVCGMVWMPFEPTAMSPDRLQQVSMAHPLGTDKLGRDILSRVMYGSRVTLMVALGTMLVGAVPGILLGAVTGFYGGVVDEVVMRVTDALLAFPSVLLALVFVSLFGSSTLNVMWALGIAFVPSFVRVARSEVIRCKHLDYVKNARLMGVGDMRVVFVHILPNVRGVLLSNLMIGFNNAVLSEAGLSYLGIGSQPPYASLGQMVSEAQEVFFTVPSAVIGPGLVIVLMVLGFSLMGEGLRAARGV